MILIIISLSIIAFLIFFFTILTKEEGENSMSKFRNLYLYLVSFVTLMMILGGIIFTVQNITDVVFPTNYFTEVMPYEKSANLSVEEKEAYDENQKIIQENRRMDSKKNVVKSIAVVAVAFPTFVYHWRKIEKEK
jgi:hypothetical protein